MKLSIAALLKSKQAALSGQPELPTNQLNLIYCTKFYVSPGCRCCAKVLPVDQDLPYHLVVGITEDYGVKPAGH